MNFSLELPSQKGLVTGDVAANLYPPSTNRGLGNRPLRTPVSIPIRLVRPTSTALALHHHLSQAQRTCADCNASRPFCQPRFSATSISTRLYFGLGDIRFVSCRVRSLVHYSACYVRLRQLSNHPCPVASRLLSSASRTFNTTTIRIEFEASS